MTEMGRTISEKEMKERYGNTTGIIARTFYETPQASRYGTFDDFLRIAKKLYADGEIKKNAEVGYHDGKEKIKGSVYDGYIEHYVYYPGKSSRAGKYSDLEFVVISHSHHVGNKMVWTKFEKPAASNFEYFSKYRKVMSKPKR